MFIRALIISLTAMQKVEKKKVGTMTAKKKKESIE